MRAAMGLWRHYGVHPASWGLSHVFDIESRIEFQRCRPVGDQQENAHLGA
jgi:hypothetical protein